MKNLWNDDEAAEFSGELGQRVYTSRLLGRDKSLVLHGGGNTSVKLTERNVVGEDENLLYVKGSGWDLEFIERDGFSPVRMPHLLKLAELESLSDPVMVNELKTQVTVASAPTPSVETILHAILPYKYVDHTHADAVVTITNSVHGEARIREIYGDRIVIIPYVMPGFDLARKCASRFSTEANDNTIGMVLLNHGIFSFGETAKQSYDRMIELVGMAEDYLKSKLAWELAPVTVKRSTTNLTHAIVELRANLSSVSGMPMIVSVHSDDQALSFAQREDIAKISQQGPATPDHVIRTKRIPMLGRDVGHYVSQYITYFAEHAQQAAEEKTMLDPAPRVALDPELGLLCMGRTAKDAAIVEDIYRHTMDIILRATALGAFQALPGKDIFDVEYWDLEQAKLRKGGKPPVFSGEVAMVTGAASGIGKACAESLLARGAAVVGLDINPEIATLFSRQDYLGITCDLHDEINIVAAINQAVKTFGGIDMLVLNAGLFPAGQRIESLTSETWREVMQINLDANLILLRECYPMLKLAPNSGRVVVIGSKNVPAPGPGAAAYSASKAALTQLTRIAALEWGADGIRINTLHPDAIFDTGIWTEEVLQARARAYNMSVEEYKTKNVLKTELCSHDVAELAAEMCGPLFAKTTASQLPIDGGNERVI